MSEQKTALAIPQQQIQLAKKIDSVLLDVSNNLQNAGGFERAIIQATAIETIESLLTEETMKPIMSLRGKKIGFLTDLDKEASGYGWKTVRNCLIEAKLNGVEVTGNQFNIIAAKCYITKEGFAYLLRKISNLWFEFIPSVPKKEDEKTVVDVTINWKIGDGKIQSVKRKFPVKVNSGMGDDAILGKLERKVYKWLYTNITGKEISDGDATVEATYTVVEDNNEKNPGNTENNQDQINEVIEEVETVTEEQHRADQYFKGATSLKDLEQRLANVQKAGIKNLNLNVYNEILTKFENN